MTDKTNRIVLRTGNLPKSELIVITFLPQNSTEALRHPGLGPFASVVQSVRKAANVVQTVSALADAIAFPCDSLTPTFTQRGAGV